jgi:hypothetical protein
MGNDVIPGPAPIARPCCPHPSIPFRVEVIDAVGNPIIVRGLLEYSVEDAAGMWGESRDTVF